MGTAGRPVKETVRNWSHVVLSPTMHASRSATGLWQDLEEAPAALEQTLASAAQGIEETAALLAGARRIVATGNGAAWYVCQALWLAALDGRGGGPELVSAPGGLVARGGFAWREGDVLLAVSSSGEFRDVIEAIEAGAPRPYAAITARADSTVGRGAGARAVQTVLHQRAVTHTQAWVNGVALALLVWARVTGDAALAAAVAEAPGLLAAAVERADAWGREVSPGLATPRSAVVFGSGPAWAAALEGSLLLKEISRVPGEGAETREGATTAMFGVGPGDLVVSLATRDDPLLDEAERLCRAAGAVVLRAPGAEVADRRLAPILAFPALCALAADLALAGGHDVDHPAWEQAYYETARAAAPADDATGGAA